MFLLTFAIGMVVAFIIKISVRGVEFSQNIRDEKYHAEMKRLRSIKRIRNSKNLTRLNKMEEASKNNVLNYYYGKNNRKTEKTEEGNNDIIEYYYGRS
jgi:hypothetical protein